MINSWQREDSGDVFIKVITFLFSPFLSFMISLNKIKTKSSFVIFFLFAVLYGMALTTSDGADMFNTNDAAVYRGEFSRIIGTSFDEFSDECTAILQQESRFYKDLYFYVVAYWVSTFTDNYHVLFMVFAIVFAFFMLRSLKILLDNPQYTHGIFGLILLYLFTFNGISNINGVRFWTAAWVAVYCLLQILVLRKKKYIFLLITTPLIHLSFVFLLLVYGVYFISGGLKRRIWIFLLVLSFVLSSLSAYLVQYFFSFSVGALVAFEGYSVTAFQGVDELVNHVSFVQVVFNALSRLYIMILFLMVYNAKTQTDENNGRNSDLFGFLFIALIAINFLSPIPSLGTRFFVFLYPLVVYLWIDTFGTKKYQGVILCLPVVFFYTIYSESISHLIRFVGIKFFISSPFQIISECLLK